MYSSLLLCLRRYARCFDFHVSLNVVVDNSFRHVFERDAVVRPLCPLANPLCGCFCLGSCPFCVSGLLFFFDETQIWLGDLRVVWLVCVILVCCDLPAFSDLLGRCTNDVFTAYAHVRTEPQCDIGHTRGKKKNRKSRKKPDGGSLYALISQFTGSMQHATERVERPGESQEALDGKKIAWTQGWLHFTWTLNTWFKERLF